MTTNELQTLSQRLAEATLPAQDALRLAMSLAVALRRIHDEGRVHGALAPSNIGLTSAGVELLPAPIPSHKVTPYTAPEVLQGRPADVRSDIFSFGAIVYEMITGRPPFAGETPDALVEAVLNTPVPGTGGRAVDVLLSNCLAKDPAGRWQRMQKVQMELKLLTVSARRTETPAHGENIATLVRAEVQQMMASQVGPRLDAQNKTIAEFQQAVSASLQTLQAHLCTIDAKLTAAQESASRADEILPKLAGRVSGLEERVGGSGERLSKAEMQLQTIGERLGRSEQTTESVRNQAAEFAESAALQLHALEQTVHSQADALESARTALAQTDDLVERVVEALDSLQSIVLEHSEGRPSGVS
jgi:eukaryotic-like serine/threonine-protein kinase